MRLRDIAATLNLSVSTVSRALNRPEMVAEDTRNQILELAKTNSYHPNGIARSLKKGATPILGLVVSDIQNPFYSSLVRIIERTASQKDYSIIICNADENPQTEAQALNLLAELKVAGIIHGSTGCNVDLLLRLRKQGIPIVDVDRVSGLEDADTVLVDNFLGGQMAAEHLLQMGHKQIGVIAGPMHLTTGYERLEGFRRALEIAGHSLPDEYVRVGDFREDSGERETYRLLDLKRPPTALFVANNEMAAGALTALRRYKIRIPKDMSVISFDNVRWSEQVDPPLTVIEQPIEEIGVSAVKLIFERFEGRSERVQQVLNPELISRDSCSPPKRTSSRTRPREKEVKEPSVDSKL